MEEGSTRRFMKGMLVGYEEGRNKGREEKKEGLEGKGGR